MEQYEEAQCCDDSSHILQETDQPNAANCGLAYFNHRYVAVGVGIHRWFHS